MILQPGRFLCVCVCVCECTCKGKRCLGHPWLFTQTQKSLSPRLEAGHPFPLPHQHTDAHREVTTPGRDSEGLTQGACTADSKREEVNQALNTYHGAEAHRVDEPGQRQGSEALPFLSTVGKAHSCKGRILCVLFFSVLKDLLIY